MSGLYSMPSARAPRFAAVMTVRPSPEPRSITKSADVTFAMSSILSTTTCGVGTQTTSLPGWPTSGSNLCAGWACACASVVKAKASASAAARIIARSPWLATADYKEAKSSPPNGVPAFAATTTRLP